MDVLMALSIVAMAFKHRQKRRGKNNMLRHSPTLDKIDETPEEAYKALPDRFYTVNAEGRIAWRGEPGPWGFDVDAWESAILGIGIY